MSTNIRYAVTAGTALITLEGPSTRNSLDPASAAELQRVCDDIDDDPTVGAAVLTGAGPAFCSGASRDALAELPNLSATDAYELLDSLYGAFLRFGSLRVPTVAAVNGPAVGAGLNLALAADVRLMAPSAVLVSGFQRIGLHPGGGHFHLLERAGGMSTAAAVGLLDQPVGADRAVALGMAWESVAPDQLVTRAFEITAGAGKDPALARAAKASHTQTSSVTHGWPRAIEVERARQLWSSARSPIKPT